MDEDYNSQIENLENENTIQIQSENKTKITSPTIKNPMSNSNNTNNNRESIIWDLETWKKAEQIKKNTGAVTRAPELPSIAAASFFWIFPGLACSGRGRRIGWDDIAGPARTRGIVRRGFARGKQECRSEQTQDLDAHRNTPPALL